MVGCTCCCFSLSLIYIAACDLCGACLQAFDCVPESAIIAAAESLQYMLHATPAAVCQRLAENDADIAIIGRDQVVSDIPPHGHLRGQSCAVGDRTFDHGTRGVGGNLACPTCSVGACCVRGSPCFGVCVAQQQKQEHSLEQSVYSDDTSCCVKPA